MAEIVGVLPEIDDDFIEAMERPNRIRDAQAAVLTAAKAWAENPIEPMSREVKRGRERDLAWAVRELEEAEANG